MDESHEENVDINWVMVNNIDLAEEAVESDVIVQPTEEYEKHNNTDKSQDNQESDIDSDSISILSEVSYLHEGNNDVDTEEEIIDTLTQKTEEKKECHMDGNVKWLLVDTETNNTPEKSKKFYLDCLQEPFQELSENELGSIPSEAESEDFSTISETHNEVENVEEKNNGQLVNSLLKVNEFSLRKYLNGFLLGTALLAVSSIFLGQYLKAVEYLDEELPLYQDDLMGDIRESLSENMPEIQKKYDVPTALAFCTEKHRSDDIFMEINVKKCLDKINRRAKRRRNMLNEKEKVRKMDDYLKVKEKYLVEKEKFLIEKEFEVAKLEVEQNYKRMGKYHKKNQPVGFENAADKSEYNGHLKNINFDKSKNKKSSKRTNDKDLEKDFKSNVNNEKMEENKLCSDTNKEKCLEDTFESRENYPDSNKRFRNKDGTLKNREKYSNFKQSKSKYGKSKKYQDKIAHIRVDPQSDKSTWYFHWMKGRELLRYMNIYHT